MSRTMRFAVLVSSLLSLLATMTSTAGAVTWHNSGSTAFTATTGAGTLSSTSAALNCTSGTQTGTAPALTVGVTYAVSGTATFSGCSLGGVATGIDCGFTFTGTSQSGSVTSGTADVTCRVYQFNSQLCHLEGTVSAVYTNGPVGVFFWATGGNVVSTDTSLGHCPLGHGDRVHLSAWTFRTTSANPPRITRTA